MKNNLFSKSKIYSSPYDHIICDNFLDNYEEYDASYPLDILENSIRMDKDLTYGDENYGKIKETPFEKLDNYVYSERFISDFLSIFENSIKKRLNKNELIYNPFDMQIKPEPYELRNFISRKNINIDPEQPFIFPRIDFGVGYAGYGVNNGGRGVHTDNITRIISIMLYFSNQDELTKGQHVMYDIDSDYNPVAKKVINIKKNRLIASLQSNDAYHSVNPLLAGTRKAIYMSISCSKKIWKDYSDPKLKYMSQNRR